MWIKVSDEINLMRLKVFELSYQSLNELDFHRTGDIDYMEGLFKILRKYTEQIPDHSILVRMNIHPTKHSFLFFAGDESFDVIEPGIPAPIVHIEINNLDVIREEVKKL